MTKIMKGGIAYNSTANMVALTQAEYDVLTTAQKNNGNFYFIIDADPSYFSAENIDYNNTDSGLTATNIQDAIDEVVGDIPNAQVQSDWSQSDNTQVDYIKNKPTIANYGTELPMSSTDSSKVSNRITALETVDYYQVPNAVADNATAQIPSTVWAHRYILINVRRYGYLGSMLIRKQNIVEGACGAGVCIYASVSPKVFKISETGLFTALQNFGTDGQWVEFIGMF